jgi:O-antigen/teichoic acid export membrane protein
LSEKTRSHGRIREFMSKGSVAVLEEGLFAGSNFVIGVLLARWLSPVEYGAFTSAYSLFLLLGAGFYSTICVQPVLVFGSRDHPGQFGQYFGSLLWVHAGLAGVVSLAMVLAAGVSWYEDSVELIWAFLALAVVSPLITLSWLARRAHYALLQPQWPLYCGAVYLALVVSGSYALSRTHLLSPTSALLMLGIASLLISLPLIALIHPRRWPTGSILTPRAILARHWQYGKWPTLTSSLRWAAHYAYYLLLPLYAGLEASAQLRAHMNLVLPILHANSALYSILIPQFARIFAQHRAEELWRYTRTVVALYALAAVVFWALLIVFSEQIFSLLYGGQYHADIRLFALLGLLPLSGGIAGVLESALFAAGRPRAAATSYAVSAFMSLTLGWGLLAVYGLVGAGMGMLAASLAAAATMGRAFMRASKSKDGAAAALPGGN